MNELCSTYQPADTLLSQINKGHGPQGSMIYRLVTLGREAGFKGLFAGLGPRMIMTAGLVSSQFLMYDAIKHCKQRRISTSDDAALTFYFQIQCSAWSTSWYRDPQGGINDSFTSTRR